jgi:signal peptidase I
MNDRNPENPFAAPEPERFEAVPHQPELTPAPAPEPPANPYEQPLNQGYEPQSHPYETPTHGYEQPVHAYAPAADAGPQAEALLPMVDPLLPSDPASGAIAASPDARLAMDGTTVWLNRLGEELVAWLKTLASAAVYATLIVTFGFQVARVEGMSMAPTLQDQDRLIVNKLAYRLGDPKVGDIVMLYYPLKPEKSFVKRIIAEEGDQVRIVDGRVFRNDVPLDDSFVPQEYRSHDDWGPQVIPEGYYFVMGDHRNNSSDSRHWGFVPKKYIIGKVQLRWWPMGHAQVF